MWSWGSGPLGQLGLGPDRLEVATPTLLEDLSGFQVGCVGVSETNVIAVTGDGQVFVWGSNSNGALGTGWSESFSAFPEVLLPFPGAVVSACCGKDYFIALTPEHIYGWGDPRRDGMLGSTEPQVISSLEALGIASVMSGGLFCLALGYNGEVYSWGNGKAFQTGHPRPATITSPTLVKSLSTLESIQLACSSNLGMALHMEPPPQTPAKRISQALETMETTV